MDSRQVFRDGDVRKEFLDRFGELTEAGATAEPGALEGLEVMPDVDAAVGVIDGMAEGVYEPGGEPGLEAIIERFTRPVYLVRHSTFTVPPDEFPNSEEIHSRLDRARARLEAQIPSTGRIDLRNHRLDWVGTGWMVAEDVMVTNRHVAREFGTELGGGFAFRQNFGRPPVRVSVDWRHEHQQPEESIFKIEEILWIEPDDSVDVALLRVGVTGDAGEARPGVIELMTREEVDAAGVGTWVAVVGYPAFDTRNDLADQQRIFDGIYNAKRLAPGQVTAVADADVLHHDATTLGGNSGSVLVDLDSGKAMALHFGGIEGQRNEAVQAPRVRQVLDRLAR
jgi:Trypsin-like peptidase domain